MNLNSLCKYPCKSTPEDYFQWSGRRTVKSDSKSDGAKLYVKLNFSDTLSKTFKIFTTLFNKM